MFVVYIEQLNAGLALNSEVLLFISYARQDIDYVRGLLAGLRDKNVDYWLDEHNIPIGEAFVARLGKALTEADGLVLFDTAASRRSYWVRRELLVAQRKRRIGEYHTLARVTDSWLEDGNRWDIRVSSIVARRELPSKLRLRRDAATAQRGRDSASGSPSAIRFGQPANWLGRQEDLARLDSWWTGSTKGLWVEGVAGTGKSGLVGTWITALEHLGYDTDAKVSVEIISAKDLADSSRAGGHEQWRGGSLGGDGLLVVDGIDETAGDRLRYWISEALNQGGRVLVTSRAGPPVALAGEFATLELSALSNVDAAALLGQNGLPDHLTGRAVQELGGHPLAIRIFGGLLSQMEPEEALQRLITYEEPVGEADSLNYSLSFAFDRLSSTDQELLRRLCKFEDDVVRLPDALGTRSLSGGIVASLGELARVGFVTLDRLDEPTRLSVHPLVKAFVNK